MNLKISFNFESLIGLNWRDLSPFDFARVRVYVRVCVCAHAHGRQGIGRGVVDTLDTMDGFLWLESGTLHQGRGLREPGR